MHRDEVSIATAIRAALFVAGLVAAPSYAGTSEEIARIEQGLRPAVGLSGTPVQTRKLAEEMRRLHVPGVSVAVIHNGAIAWAKGYGVSYANGPAVTPDTLFQAASISKPVTAMAALRMVEEEQLDLDADINTVLTSWKLPPGPGQSKATLRQLLSHTAGTGVSGFPGYAAGAPVPTLIQVLDGATPANTKPVRIETAPGSAWRYSGGGYAIVQQAMIDRAARPFDVLLADSVLKPIGMNDSAFTQPLPPALLARAALPHDERGEPIAGGPYTYPELAAAGMWTTPTDLARFALEIQRTAAGRGSGVLSRQAMRAMLQPVRQDYALGLDIEGKGASLAFGHGGSNMGYQNSLYAYVEHGDGAVVMTNGDAGAALAQSLIRAIAAEYGWPSYQTRLRKTVQLPPATRKALAGRYEVKGLGGFEIFNRDGRMMVSLRGGALEPLYAQSPRVLFVLSRELELRFAPGKARAGQLVSGPFDVRFKRVK